MSICTIKDINRCREFKISNNSILDLMEHNNQTPWMQQIHKCHRIKCLQLETSKDLCATPTLMLSGEEHIQDKLATNRSSRTLDRHKHMSALRCSRQADCMEVQQCLHNMLLSNKIQTIIPRQQAWSTPIWVLIGILMATPLTNSSQFSLKAILCSRQLKCFLNNPVA